MMPFRLLLSPFGRFLPIKVNLFNVWFNSSFPFLVQVIEFCHKYTFVHNNISSSLRKLLFNPDSEILRKLNHTWVVLESCVPFEYWVPLPSVLFWSTSLCAGARNYVIYDIRNELVSLYLCQRALGKFNSSFEWFGVLFVVRLHWELRGAP